MKKTQTPCCALCFLSGVGNNTTKEEIQAFIENTKNEAFYKEWKPDDRQSGERSILTVATNTEETLKETLKECGFIELHDNLSRRYGYPEGQLTLLIYSF